MNASLRVGIWAGLVGLGAVIASAGCNGNGPATVVSDGGHMLPALLANAGGPVMKTPVMAPIIWANDPNASQLAAFFPDLANSSIFNGQLTQYGLQSLSTEAVTQIAGPLPTSLTDADLRNVLKQAVAAAAADGGNVSGLANGLFIFILPEGTGFTATINNQTVALCQQAAGYHSFLTVPNAPPIIYAVGEQCSLGPPYPSSPFDMGTIMISHEVAEAITDPQELDIDPADQAASQPAWNHTSDYAWQIVLGEGGEVGDLCNFPWTYFRDPGGFAQQHVYSNSAAQAGGDPCGSPLYYGVAPPDGTLQPLAIGQSLHLTPLSGLTIPVGQSMTVPLSFFSNLPTDPFQVRVVNLSDPKGDAGLMTLNLASTQGQNGQVDSLDITVHASGTVSGQAGFEALVLEGYNFDGGIGALWPLLIASP